MSGRPFRVIKRLPRNEDGEVVIYEPGDTVHLADWEVVGFYHSLEGIDDAGRYLLRNARANVEEQENAMRGDVPAGLEMYLEFAGFCDGSKTLISITYRPTNPLPGVVYGTKGQPLPWTTATQREQRKLEQLERTLQSSRRKGGSAPKHLPGLQAEVDRLAIEHPQATARELWNLIPESEDDSGPIGGFSVYRDGSKVVQVEHATGREKGIFFRSFGRYVTRARSK
jgi:hypothetical protein